MSEDYVKRASEEIAAMISEDKEKLDKMIQLCEELAKIINEFNEKRRDIALAAILTVILDLTEVKLTNKLGALALAAFQQLISAHYASIPVVLRSLELLDD